MTPQTEGLDSEARPLTFIDLFSGCGGFSLGLQDAGLKCLAGIDADEPSIETFRVNHPGALALVRDLTKFAPKQLGKLLGSQRVDVVIGGPPCQGFSKARQVDGANHGDRLVHDARRDLYREFLRFVVLFQPSVFVMENVPGLRSAAGGTFFTRVQAESREIGYRVIPYEVESWRFGVPQQRRRQLVIGTRRELPLFIPDKYIRRTHAEPDATDLEGLAPAVTLGEAIGDLPPIQAGDERIERRYSRSRLEAHVRRYGTRYTCDVLHADKAEILAGHSAREHSERDLRDFARLREGETSRQALIRGVEMEFPYSRDKFKDRFTRQHRDRLCSTIVAHLKKDGLMFIHPTQQRSLTPREAARVQSFPDTFHLPFERTHAYSQIGNAVPPLVGKAMGLAIRDFLAAADDSNRIAPYTEVQLPSSREAATTTLESLIESLYLRQLTDLSASEFLRIWWAVGFLHPHLHPDAAIEHGSEVSRGTKRGVSYVVEPFYVRSGWPVELVPIAREARRRFDAKLLGEDEYYCSAAVIAGAAMHQLAG